jgi:hypothetical protein
MLSQKMLTKVNAIPGYLQSILPSIKSLEEVKTSISDAKPKREERIYAFRGPMQQQLAAARTASKANRDFSFSGSGFLAAFHLGAASSLMKKGLLTKKSKLAGASGGALIGEISRCVADIHPLLTSDIDSCIIGC